MMMIKDNHIAAAGGIAAAVAKAERYIESHGLGVMEVEVETRTMQVRPSGSLGRGALLPGRCHAPRSPSSPPPFGGAPARPAAASALCPALHPPPHPPAGGG
jgi:hypothetical protein